MQANVTWHHGLTFNGTADTGFSVNLGGSPAAGGDNDGFRPMELVLVGLAGCTGMDVISILRKMRQDVTRFAVMADGDRTDTHPKVFTHIQLHYVIHGRGLEKKSVEKAIALSAERYCPVQAMLSPTVEIDLGYEIIEEAEDAPA